MMTSINPPLHQRQGSQQMNMLSQQRQPVIVQNTTDSDNQAIMIKKLQSQIKDLEKNLVLNKDILNRLLSSSPDDNLNTSLMSMIRELQTKNGTLEVQIASLMQEKQQIQSFASQQAESFTEQIKQLQEQSMSDQERRLMKEQIIMVQQKLAEKETKYIKLDNELRTKKKEMEKLQRKLEDTLGSGTGTIKDGEEFK